MPEAPKTRNLPDDPAHGLRTPPQSIQSEQAVLGGLLIDNTALDSVADLITAEDFCRRDHQIIYEHIVSLIQHGKPADIVTVGESIKNSGAQTALADGQYLQSLFSNTPSAANIRRYAEIVRDRAMLRQMIQVGEGMVPNALNPQGRDPEELLDEAEREVLAINERNARGRQGFRSLSTLVREVSERIIELYQNKDNSEVTGVATGFPNLDRVTAGFQRGDLIILAARPSMGKTAFALNMAMRAAVQDNVPVAIYSLEMSMDQLMMRMLCAWGKVDLGQRLTASGGRLDSQRLRKGALNDEEWDKFTAAVSILEKKPIHIDDTGNMTVTSLSTRARRLMNQTGPLGLIVVDYLQLMRSSRRTDSRELEISDISRSLKAIAKELDVPVVALSQLNRKVEERKDNRPMLSDLRESGAIEQDADIVIFLYRDEVYKPDTPKKGIAELIIGKHRNGRVGTVELAFLPQYTAFEPLAKDR